MNREIKKRRGGKQRLMQVLQDVSLKFGHLVKKAADDLQESHHDSDSDDSLAQSIRTMDSTQADNNSDRSSSFYSSTLSSTSSSIHSAASDDTTSGAETEFSSSSSSTTSSTTTSTSSSGSFPNYQPSLIDQQEQGDPGLSFDSSDGNTNDEMGWDRWEEVEEFYSQAGQFARGLSGVIGRVNKRRRLDPDPVSKSSQLPLVLEDFKVNDHDRFRRNLRGMDSVGYSKKISTNTISITTDI